MEHQLCIKFIDIAACITTLLNVLGNFSEITLFSITIVLEVHTIYKVSGNSVCDTKIVLFALYVIMSCYTGNYKSLSVCKIVPNHIAGKNCNIL